MKEFNKNRGYRALSVSIACFVVLCTMLIFSGSWFIVSNLQELFTNGKLDTPKNELSDPYYTVVDADGSTDDGYFAYDGNNIYSNSKKTLTITEAGAQALFGVSKETADTEGKYTVTWKGGEYFNVKLTIRDHVEDVVAISSEAASLFAGQHYYEITDTATGQVIYYKYHAPIQKDTLTGGTTTISGLKFDGDPVTGKLSWTGVNSKVSIEAKEYTGTADFNDGTTVLTHANAVSVSPDETFVRTYMSSPESIINNYNLAGSTAATLSYTVGASVSSTTTSATAYYGDLVAALNATNNATVATVVIPLQSVTYNGTAYTPTHTIHSDVVIGTNVSMVMHYDASFDPSEYLGASGTDGDSGEDKKATYMRETLGVSNSFTITVDAPEYCKSEVTLAAGKTLTVKGSLNIAAQIAPGAGSANKASSIAGYYAKLVMQSGSKIETNGNAAIHCYGLISEDQHYQTDSANKPTITLNENAKMTNLFTIVEHRGGGGFLGIDNINEKDVAPFNRFFTRSITSKVVVKHGAQVNSFYALGFDTGSVTICGMIALFGDEGTSFLKMNHESSDADANKPEIRFTYNTATDKNEIDVIGNAQINSISVTISMGVNRTISTAKAFLPISHYWNIEFYPNASGKATVNIPNQNVKILPGGYVKVHSGVTANVQSFAIYDKSYYDKVELQWSGRQHPNIDGQLVVDGTLIAKSIGGVITTESQDAKIQITTNNSVTSREASSFPSGTQAMFGTKANTVSYTFEAQGLLQTSASVPTTNTKLAVTTYGSAAQTSPASAWWYNTSLNITYNTGVTPATKSVSGLTSPGFALTDSYYPTPITLPDYYDFLGWYNGTQLVSAGTKIYTNVSLEAKWEPKEYTTNFIATGPAGETIPAPPDNITFDVDTTNVLANIANPNSPYGELMFLGWYKDEGGTIAVSTDSTGVYMISGLDLIENGCKLYMKWGQGTKYNIVYTTENGYNIPEANPNAMVGSSLAGWSTANDPTKTHEFVSWLYDIDGDGDLDRVSSVDDLIDAYITINGSEPAEGQTFTVQAEWTEKQYKANISGTSGGNKSITLGGTLYAVDADNLAKILIQELYGTTGYAQQAKQYDSDYTVNKIFDKWVDSNGTTIPNNLTELGAMITGNTFDVTAQWRTKKYSLSVVADSSGNGLVGNSIVFNSGEILFAETLDGGFINEANNLVFNNTDSYTVQAKAYDGWNTNSYKTNKAFKEWVVDNSENVVTTLSNAHFEANNKLILTAQWEAKCVVSITYGSSIDSISIGGINVADGETYYICRGETSLSVKATGEWAFRNKIVTITINGTGYVGSSNGSLGNSSHSVDYSFDQETVNISAFRS